MSVCQLLVYPLIVWSILKIYVNTHAKLLAWRRQKRQTNMASVCNPPRRAYFDSRIPERAVFFVKVGGI